MENDQAPLDIGLHSDSRKPQDRTGWRRFEATATSWHGVYNDDDYDICDCEHRLK